MIDTKIIINKNEALREIRRLTSYSGAKTPGDEGAYERKSATKSDDEMLEMWLREALSKLEDILKPFTTNTTFNDNITIELCMSSSWDETLSEGIGRTAFSYVVNYVADKWLEMTGSKESYMDEALRLLTDLNSKIYYRKKPVRVKPT